MAEFCGEECRECEDFMCFRCKKVEQTIFVPKRDKDGKPLFPKEMYEDWD